MVRAIGVALQKLVLKVQFPPSVQAYRDHVTHGCPILNAVSRFWKLYQTFRLAESFRA
jgi:hypothetical protein